MIGNCDCCDRQNVPVTHFEAGATNAQCETTACFICQGETEIDPYGEMDDRKEVSKNGQVLSMSDALALVPEIYAGDVSWGDRGGGRGWQARVGSYSTIGNGGPYVSDYEAVEAAVKLATTTLPPQDGAA